MGSYVGRKWTSWIQKQNRTRTKGSLSEVVCPGPRRVNNLVSDPRSKGRKGGKQRKMEAKIKEPLCQVPFLPQNAQRGPQYAPSCTACSSGFCLHWLTLSVSLSPSPFPCFPPSLSHADTQAHSTYTYAQTLSPILCLVWKSHILSYKLLCQWSFQLPIGRQSTVRPETTCIAIEMEAHWKIT